MKSARKNSGLDFPVFITRNTIMQRNFFLFCRIAKHFSEFKMNDKFQCVFFCLIIFAEGLKCRRVQRTSEIDFKSLNPVYVLVDNIFFSFIRNVVVVF